MNKSGRVAQIQRSDGRNAVAGGEREQRFVKPQDAGVAPGPGPFPTKRDGPVELIAALLGVALVMGPVLCGQLAHADPVAQLDGGPNPDGGLDYGAMVDVPFAVYVADGGPVDGECTTTRRAAFNAAYCAQDHYVRKALGAELLKQDPGWSTPEVAVVAAVVSVAAFAAGVLCTVKVIDLARK